MISVGVREAWVASAGRGDGEAAVWASDVEGRRQSGMRQGIQGAVVGGGVPQRTWRNPNGANMVILVGERRAFFSVLLASWPFFFSFAVTSGYMDFKRERKFGGAKRWEGGRTNE